MIMMRTKQAIVQARASWNSALIDLEVRVARSRSAAAKRRNQFRCWRSMRRSTDVSLELDWRSCDASASTSRRRRVRGHCSEKQDVFFRLGPVTVLTQAWKDSAWAEPSKLSLSIPNAVNETAYCLGIRKFWFYFSDYWSREIWLTNL